MINPALIYAGCVGNLGAVVYGQSIAEALQDPEKSWKTIAELPNKGQSKWPVLVYLSIQQPKVST
jgi:hypothetical protein